VEDHPENDDQDTDQKHENGNPVNTVHIADPTAGWFIRIPFPYIKVFCQFAKYSHSDIKDN
jgi:hypothetical protein